jgi:hypothetical protein
MVHPAKIVTASSNDAEVCHDLCGNVHSAQYARMIPVLDHEIPSGKRRKCDQFCYAPNCDNSQQEYLHNELVRKRSYREPSSTILESLSRNVRCVLNFCQRLLTHRHTAEGLNDEFIPDDYHIYHEEWHGMRSKQRGLVTTTCSEGTNTSLLRNMSYIHPQCILPPREWANFVKVTKAMMDFALTCIPKINFPGVDICLFDLCTCLDYGIEMMFDLQMLLRLTWWEFLSQMPMSVMQLKSSFKFICGDLPCLYQHFFIIIISSFCHILTHLLNSH